MRGLILSPHFHIVLQVASPRLVRADLVRVPDNAFLGD